MNLFPILSPRARPGDRTRQVQKRWFAALAAAVALAGVGSARAEGPGIKVGESLVLHPGVSLGAGYDSNVFYASDTAFDAPQGAFYLTVRPGLDLATRPAQRDGGAAHTVDFRLHAGLPLRFLLTGSSEINTHYSIGADAGLLLSLFPFAEWSFDLFDNFVRTSDPPYSVVKAAFVNQQGQNINTDQNQLGARLKWRPGGQRFETSLQYALGIYYFESSPLAAKSSLTNDFQLRVKWNFFPKTALYINADETINTYYNSNLVNSPPSAYPFRIVAGLIGLITTKFSVNVNIGYGNSFTQSNLQYMGNNSYSSVVGLVELGWKPTPFTIIDLGYRHDFAQALIGTYYDLDMVFASINQLIWRFTGSLRGSWERRGFNGHLAPDGLIDGRVDNILALHAEIDYPIKDYLIISLGDDLVKNFSSTNGGSTCFLGPNLSPPCNYLRNDVWLRLSFSY